MQTDSIRPFYDSEVNVALLENKDHPYMLALMDYAFPEKDKEFYHKKLSSCHSIKDFQGKIIYPALQRILKETTDGMSTSGFDLLNKESAYLYISNHRDIVLDTSLTNMVLYEKDMNMTASAIGDNLVRDPFLYMFSKVNRNFLVRRSLSPRELLLSSRNLSEYMFHLVTEEKRSIWLAQREGRTKDGNDKTQAGIIKMLTLGKPKKEDVFTYLKKLNIVPLSISYELDPTDYMKMPALMANYYNEEYVKTKNEDFNNILTGVLGRKKRIHISAGSVINDEIDEIRKHVTSPQQGIKAIAELITDRIHEGFQLWPTNYIAHDLLYDSKEFSDKYTPQEKQKFQDRVNKKTDSDNEFMVKSFMAMYAYPVINKLSKKKEILTSRGEVVIS